MSDRLEHFVRDALARGADRDAIRAALSGAGWPAAEIDAALGAWVDTPFGVPAPRRRVQTSAREAFLYLVMFATLYVVAFHVGALLFAGIERMFPDPAFYERWPAGLRGVRASTAAVLIAFPVFAWVARHIGGLLQKEPEKRASGVRRWLTWLTLFLAALVLIGDLVVVLTQALSGELAMRFTLKSGVVFAIAGMVFGHYFAGMRSDEAEGPPPAPWTGWIARVTAVAVPLVAVLGLWMSGSPIDARSYAIDQRRAQDLQEIQGGVNDYYSQFGVLPDSLGTLRGPKPGTRLPDLRDPVTDEPYAYRVLDPRRYELCATFERKSRDDEAGMRPAPGDFWRHPAGRTCYSLVVPEPRGR
jgi:hypothetical protein